MTSPTRSSRGTRVACMPIRVLAISGQPIVVWGIEQLLLASGSGRFLVETAADGKSAVALIHAGSKPDIILLDLDPDPQQGIAAIPRLLAHPTSRMLVLVGGMDEQIYDEAVLAGSHGVLQKKQPLEVMLKAIEKVYQGETWIDREAVGRISRALAQRAHGKAGTGSVNALTRRERDVVEQVLKAPGSPAKVLARELGISENTLNNHLASIYGKVGVANRMELYAFMQSNRPTRETQKGPTSVPLKKSAA